MITVERDGLAAEVVDELLGRLHPIQEEIIEARSALAEADAALVKALAALGIPTRPVAVSSLRGRPTRGKV
jgi:hypothetical protein